MAQADCETRILGEDVGEEKGSEQVSGRSQLSIEVYGKAQAPTGEIHKSEWMPIK